MATVVKVSMRRATPSGVSCNSSRPIVVWGKPVTQETLDALESALCEARELYNDQAFVKGQSSIITEVCNGLFGKEKWDFVVQGGEVNF